MSFALIGFFVSICTALTLYLFFRYEEKKSYRFASHLRSRIDFFVLKTEHIMHSFLRFIGRDFVRQILHYFFHTVLNMILSLLKKSEQGLRDIMRANRTIAKNAEQESEFRSKLEEIALHKVSTALTEEEKKEHREKMLNGM